MKFEIAILILISLSILRSMFSKPKCPFKSKQALEKIEKIEQTINKFELSEKPSTNNKTEHESDQNTPKTNQGFKITLFSQLIVILSFINLYMVSIGIPWAILYFYFCGSTIFMLILSTKYNVFDALFEVG